MRWIGWAAGLALAGWGALAGASTFVTTTTMCPVGGESFSHRAYASYSSFGSLPDGMPIGSAEFPIELTACPENGLVLYRDFEEDEIETLSRFVLSPEYQRLREDEQPYYRAFRIATVMGDDEQQRGGLLQAAWWQAKNAGNAEQSARYGDEFVRWAARQPDDSTSLIAVVIRVRAVNALRELGRFAEAEALRSSLHSPPLAESASERDQGEVDGLMVFVDRLAAPIARGDASRAPIDLMSLRQAAFRCANSEDAAELSPFDKVYCARPELQDDIASVRALRASERRLNEPDGGREPDGSVSLPPVPVPSSSPASRCAARDCAGAPGFPSCPRSRRSACSVRP